MNVPDWFYLGCILAMGIANFFLYRYLRSIKKKLDEGVSIKFDPIPHYRDGVAFTNSDISPFSGEYTGMSGTGTDAEWKTLGDELRAQSMEFGDPLIKEEKERWVE